MEAATVGTVSGVVSDGGKPVSGQSVARGRREVGATAVASNYRGTTCLVIRGSCGGIAGVDRLARDPGRRSHGESLRRRSLYT